MEKIRAQKKRELRKKIHEQIRRNGRDILCSENHINTRNHIQHGTMTVREHNIRVAEYSLLLKHILKIHCNTRDLIRGALLHDYFLYDWHDKDHVKIQNLHGIFHPGVSLKNAEKEYFLTGRQRDIIKKHMWPLTLIPPVCREAWLVTAADKYCSFMETVGIHKGHRGHRSG